MFADKKIFREYKRIKITNEDIERIKKAPKKGFKHPNETWKSIVSAKSAYEAFMKRDDVKKHNQIKHLVSLYEGKLQFEQLSKDATQSFPTPGVLMIEVDRDSKDWIDFMMSKNITNMSGPHKKGTIFSMFNMAIRIWKKYIMSLKPSGIIQEWQELRRNLDFLYDLLHLELTALKIYRKQVYDARQAGQSPPNPPEYLKMTKEEKEKIMKPRPNPPARAEPAEGGRRRRRRRGRGRNRDAGQGERDSTVPPPAAGGGGEGQARARSRSRPR